MDDFNTGHVETSREICPSGYKWLVTFIELPGDVSSMEIDTSTLVTAGTVNDWIVEEVKGSSASGRNEVQEVTLSGTSLSGFFRLNIAGNSWSDAHLLPFDATDSHVERALEDFVTIGQVEVTRNASDTDDGYTWSITFQSTSMSSWDVPTIEINTDSIVGSSVEGTVTETVVGETPVDYNYALVPSTYRSSTIDNLDAGSEYTVRVTAMNVRGLGTFSSQDKTYTIPLQVPGAPADLTSTVDIGEPHNIVVSYNDPASNGGTEILKYSVEWCELSETVTTEEACFEGQRTLRGSVVNSAGQSIDSSSEVRCPSHPLRQIYRVESSGSSGSFKMSLTRNGDVVETGWIARDAVAMRSEEVNVYCDESNSFTECDASQTTPQGSIQSHLEAISSITYKGVEVKRFQPDSSTNIWTITFLDDGNDFDLIVSDDQVAGGSGVTVTQVQEGRVFQSCTGSLTIENLQNGVDYLVRVYAVNSVGHSTGALLEYPGQRPMIVPFPPTSVAISVESDSELMCVFYAPQPSTDGAIRADGGSEILSYVVEADPSPNFDSAVSDTVINGHTFTSEHVGEILYLEAGEPFAYRISGLTMGQPYYVRVAAYNQIGYSSSQISSPAFETPKRVPAGPQSVYAHVTGPSMITLEVVPPQDQGGEEISFFKIEHDIQYDQTSYASPPDKDVAIISATSTESTFYTISSLSYLNEYFIQVSASNSMGYGSATTSAPVYIRPVASVPGVPSDISATQGSQSGRLSISWSAPFIPAHGTPCSGTYSNPLPCSNNMGRGSEADGGTKISGYFIQYDTSSTFNEEGGEEYVAVPESTAAGTAYSHELIGLDSNKSYYIRVRAVNSKGTGAYCAKSTDATTMRCTGSDIVASPAL